MIELCLMAGCGIYAALLLLVAGTRAPFWWFWLVLALASGGLYVFNQLREREIIRIKLPLWLRVGFWTTVWLVIGLVVLIETTDYIVYNTKKQVVPPHHSSEDMSRQIFSFRNFSQENSAANSRAEIVSSLSVKPEA